MQKGKVFNFKSSKFYDFISANNILVILVLLFIIGLTVGTFTENRIMLLSDYSKNYIDRFVSEHTDMTFFTVAVNSFMHGMMFLLLLFIFGSSMLGIVLIPVSVAAKGILYGSITALLYSEYSVKGIAFNAVIIVPSTIIFIVAVLLAARESVKFSLIIAKMTLPKSPFVNLNFDFKNYCGRYIFITVIVLFSAVTDSFISHTFIDKFVLI